MLDYRFIPPAKRTVRVGIAFSIDDLCTYGFVMISCSAPLGLEWRLPPTSRSLWFCSLQSCTTDGNALGKIPATKCSTINAHRDCRPESETLADRVQLYVINTGASSLYLGPLSD